MSEVVRKYYNHEVDWEWERLATPYRRFEMASTLRLIDDHFPRTGRIADIGGGPGRYTIELLRRGYRVTLVDLAERNVEFARAKLAELGLEAEGVVPADARDLSFLETESFDAALLLGPLYHLVDAADRRAALLELRRVLKPGAPAVVGFINPWGVLRALLAEMPELYADGAYVGRLLSTCVQVGEQKAFTEAAFLTPPQAMAEVRAAGFAVDVRAGVEGFAAGMEDEVKRIAAEDPVSYANVVRLVAETCDMPAFRDSTEHLHVVVRRLDPSP
ncbi:MAG: class I SAM-dependent methyltransferase [Candidatus Bipolaricaulis sp.]|nr:class I SAM-dependent methyltransferase [Candidatus Bipolaricaulis sp.]